MTNVETIDEEATRTRYSGPVEIKDLADSVVKESDLSVGRPRIDLTPYEAKLKANFTANKGRNDGKRTVWNFTVNTPALSTVKSRINQAARNINVGVTFTTQEQANGTTHVGVVCGKRITGRGRKPSASK